MKSPSALLPAAARNTSQLTSSSLPSGCSERTRVSLDRPDESNRASLPKWEGPGAFPPFREILKVRPCPNLKTISDEFDFMDTREFAQPEKTTETGLNKEESGNYQSGTGKSMEGSF
jgi:hypothetical protein